jgi:hypothetical protein
LNINFRLSIAAVIALVAAGFNIAVKAMLELFGMASATSVACQLLYFGYVIF